jgi:hypothetical protein
MGGLLGDYFNEKVDQDRAYRGPGQDDGNGICPPEGDKSIQGDKTKKGHHRQQSGIHQQRGCEFPPEQQSHGPLKAASGTVDPEYLFADTGQHVFFG